MPSYEDDAPDQIEACTEQQEGDIILPVHAYREENEHQRDADARRGGVDGVGNFFAVAGLDADGETVIFEILHDLRELDGECSCNVARIERELEQVEFESIPSEGRLKEFLCIGREGLHDIKLRFEILNDPFDAEKRTDGAAKLARNLNGVFLACGDEVMGEGGNIDFVEGLFEMSLKNFGNIVFEVTEDDASGGVA